MIRPTLKVKRNPIPDFVARQYGGRRAFRALKRGQLKLLIKAYGDLRTGCAYFPSGHGPMQRINELLVDLERDLSVENWGR